MSEKIKIGTIKCKHFSSDEIIDTEISIRDGHGTSSSLGKIELSKGTIDKYKKLGVHDRDHDRDLKIRDLLVEKGYIFMEDCTVDTTSAEEVIEKLKQCDSFRGIIEVLDDRFCRPAFEGRYVSDGVWNIEGIDFIQTTDRFDNMDRLKEFMSDNPDFHIGHAYETYSHVFLSKKPTERIDIIGDGFNYGSTNVIDNCPKRVIILAQND